MKKIFSILILILVVTISISKANNGTPESNNKRKELIQKVDRNVVAMELIFTDKKTQTLNKKTLYHRYWVVMMDFRHQMYSERSLEDLEKIERDVKEWNLRVMELLKSDTKQLEIEISSIMNVEELKNKILKVSE